MVNAGGIWWVESLSALGEVRRYSLGTGDFMEALRVMDSESNHPIVRELEDALMTDYEIKGRPQKTRRQAQLTLGALRRFCAAEALASLDELSTHALTRFAKWRLKDHAPGTVLYELKTIRRALQVLCDWGRILRVPKLPPVSPSPPRQGFLTSDQVDAICTHLDPALQPFIRFLALTGWRAGEAQGLNWRNVDFDAGVVRLEPGTTKNRDGREFPFRYLRPLEDLLRRQRNEVTRLEALLGKVVPWVFPRRGGGRICSYDWAWHSACRQAGLPGRIVHDLRRSAVRRLELAGVPRSVGMRLTGHRSERVYRAYAISGPQDLEDGLRRLDAFLGRCANKGQDRT